MGQLYPRKTMFENHTVDRFFRWPWWVVPLIWLPFAALVVGLGQALHPRSLHFLVGFLLGGVLLWTFIEYCAHRFALHFVGASPFSQHLHYVAHGMHHAWPNEPDRVIIPPFASAILGSLFGFLFYFILPADFFYPVFAGFVIGYVWYECTHYAVHHFKWKFSLFKGLKRHHLLHHHSESARNKRYGVTTPLWDFVLRTL